MSEKNKNLHQHSQGDLLEDDQFEEILFTFLRHVTSEQKAKANRIKDRFVDFLASLGEDRAERLVHLLGRDEKNKPELFSSPTVGEVLCKYLDVSNSRPETLANSLGVEIGAVKGLLAEGYRLTHINIKDVSTTIAVHFKINDQLALRELLTKGYAYFTISASRHSSIKLAAREKQ
jgi:hypothetical protein